MFSERALLKTVFYRFSGEYVGTTTGNLNVPLVVFNVAKYYVIADQYHLQPPLRGATTNNPKIYVYSLQHIAVNGMQPRIIRTNLNISSPCSDISDSSPCSDISDRFLTLWTDVCPDSMLLDFILIRSGQTIPLSSHSVL